MLKSIIISKIIANCTDSYTPDVKYKIDVFEHLNKSIQHEINMMNIYYARQHQKSSTSRRFIL